jgi:8-oxo-dGTP pyrophosphatase MutT (NUDIX family)
MAKLIHGERIGKSANLSVGCSAIIFDETRQKVLLTRRTDNRRWCLPGGRLDPGESIVECCAREVWEETGLRVSVGKLIGMYTTPDIIVEYADGNRFQIIAFNFEAEIIGGTLGLSDETTAYGYFSPAEIEELDLMEHHHQRIVDAFAGQETTFVR